MYVSASLGVGRPAAFIFADARRVNHRVSPLFLSHNPIGPRKRRNRHLLFSYFLESFVFRPVGSDIAR